MLVQEAKNNLCLVVLLLGKGRQYLNHLHAVVLLSDEIALGVGCVVVDLLEDVRREGHVVSDGVDVGHLVEFSVLLLEGVRVDGLLEDYGFLDVF